MSLFCLIALLLISAPIWPIFAQISINDLTGGADGVDEAKPEVLANKTYAQEQSDLQRAIFRSYDRKVRPIRNQSLPVTVLFHAYLMHISVDQLQQTMLLNGHIYMTWTDEMAVWDPSQFNNVRTTTAKQWELWQPDLKIANSVSGVNQYFEISKRSHATLTSMTSNRTKVEIYPTFYMKIGCNFDYSDYPFDQQECAARLYTANVMSEVELSVYYNLEPSVMLGWGNQSAKRHVSDWELLAVTANLSYYRAKKYSATRPTTAYEAQSTWALLLLGVQLRRNAPLFWLSLALPSLCCAVLNVLSFVLPRPEHSVGLLIINFFIHAMFIRDAIQALPPAVGDPPRIVVFANLLLPLTLLCLLLHLCSKTITKFLATKFGGRIGTTTNSTINMLLRPLNNLIVFNDDEQKEADEAGAQDGIQQQQLSGEQRRHVRYGNSRLALTLFRLCCALVMLLITVPMLFSLVFRMSA